MDSAERSNSSVSSIVLEICLLVTRAHGRLRDRRVEETVERTEERWS